ncbi:MAG: hypothetical protein ACPLKP_03725 [Microgenomates group bacterium]
MKDKKDWLIFLIGGLTIFLSVIAVMIAFKIYQNRRKAVAPTAPFSKPQAVVESCKISFSLLITPTPTLTPTPTPRITPTSTPTPRITPTSTPTLTSTPTPRITPTSTPTVTLTPTITPSTSPSPTPSFTPSPTVTPIVLLTATPFPTLVSQISTPTPTPFVAQIELPTAGIGLPAIGATLLGLILIFASLLLAL